MSVIGYIKLANILNDAGFPAGTSQQEGLAVIAAESGRNPLAKHDNLDTDGVTVLSTDRGIWQINDKAHPDVTDAMAYDPVQATAAALHISTNGNNYGPWSTFTNGAYHVHMEAAAVALDGALQVRKLTAADSTDEAEIASIKQQLADAQTALAAEQAQASALQTQLADVTAQKTADDQKIINARNALN